MHLEHCLPAALRGPDTTIDRVAVGFSGAGVYRVSHPTGAFALKVSRDDVPLDAWRRTLDVLRHAGEAGLAPRVVHADESCRAVVSEFVADRGFASQLFDPATREAALALLGRTVRRVHALPVPDGAPPSDARAMLATVWAGSANRVTLPTALRDAVERTLAEPVPAADRAPVLSHNDLNPSNIAFDGERVMLLDWDTAGPNDPWYDLAVIALFFRFDDVACGSVLAGYDGAPVDALPPRFAYMRRLAAAFSGAMFTLRASTEPSVADEPEAPPTLAECYQAMRAGTLNLATPDGQRRFGLALLGTIA